MIKNERQYEITNAQLDRFRETLARIEDDETRGAEIHPLLVKARKEAVQSQIADLDNQLREYDSRRPRNSRPKKAGT